MDHYKKYLKYKSKYINLKMCLHGGTNGKAPKKEILRVPGVDLGIQPSVPLRSASSHETETVTELKKISALSVFPVQILQFIAYLSIPFVGLDILINPQCFAIGPDDILYSVSMKDCKFYKFDLKSRLYEEWKIRLPKIRFGSKKVKTQCDNMYDMNMACSDYKIDKEGEPYYVICLSVTDGLSSPTTLLIYRNNGKLVFNENIQTLMKTEYSNLTGIAYHNNYFFVCDSGSNIIFPAPLSREPTPLIAPFGTSNIPVDICSVSDNKLCITFRNRSYGPDNEDYYAYVDISDGETKLSEYFLITVSLDGQTFDTPSLGTSGPVDSSRLPVISHCSDTLPKTTATFSDGYLFYFRESTILIFNIITKRLVDSVAMPDNPSGLKLCPQSCIYKKGCLYIRPSRRSHKSGDYIPSHWTGINSGICMIQLNLP